VSSAIKGLCLASARFFKKILPAGQRTRAGDFFENPSGLTLQEALRTQKYLCTRTTNRHYVP
ncbi:hypothetical protein, partial [Capnocytophaga sputigena]|uniref:hypothetical protein n=1 Tax=Capnocytophaga sputigena TaxID=1019 RepID=UPI0031F54A12